MKGACIVDDQRERDVCVCECVHMCMCVCVCVCLYMSYKNGSVCVYVCICAYMCVSLYMSHKNGSVCLYECVRMCIYICVCVCVFVPQVKLIFILVVGNVDPHVLTLMRSHAGRTEPPGWRWDTWPPAPPVLHMTELGILSLVRKDFCFHDKSSYRVLWKLKVFMFKT